MYLIEWVMKDIKGQLISKCLFGFFNFLQKTNKRIQFYYYETFCRSFFGRNWRQQKDIYNLTDIYNISKIVLKQSRASLVHKQK